MEHTGRTLCFAKDFTPMSRVKPIKLVVEIQMECTARTLCFAKDFWLIPRQSQEVEHFALPRILD